MRLSSLVVAVLLAGVLGCGVEPEPAPPGALEDPLALAAVTRTRLEHDFDTMLRANGGRACSGLCPAAPQTCLRTNLTTPPRALQIGDPIPSRSSVSVCSQGSCTILPPPPPPSRFTCSGLAICAGLASSCPQGMEMVCTTSENPFCPDIQDLHCKCVDSQS